MFVLSNRRIDIPFARILRSSFGSRSVVAFGIQSVYRLGAPSESSLALSSESNVLLIFVLNIRFHFAQGRNTCLPASSPCTLAPELYRIDNSFIDPTELKEKKMPCIVKLINWSGSRVFSYRCLRMNPARHTNKMIRPLYYALVEGPKEQSELTLRACESMFFVERRARRSI